MKKLAIIGAGRIGTALYELLKRQNQLAVEIYDFEPKKILTGTIDASDPNEMEKLRDSGVDGIVNALPHYMNGFVFDICHDLNLSYFDFSEDVDSVTEIQSILKNSPYTGTAMPQCGLAPGYINILGAWMVSQFDHCRSLQLRVGALPAAPFNSFGYATTWSVDGLINEYINDAEIVHDFHRLAVPSLDGRERIVIDGTEYEAFHTSGGAGTMVSRLGTIQDFNYKTLRYPGHLDRVKFLLDDLNLRSDRPLLQKVFSKIPTTDDDMVIIQVTGTGYINGVKKAHVISQTIYPDFSLSAIQLATAGAMAGILDLWGKDMLPTGFVHQDQIGLDDFLSTQWGSAVYE